MWEFREDSWQEGEKGVKEGTWRVDETKYWTSLRRTYGHPDFWKEMQSNRIGNLLAAARLKANLSQTQLAEKLGIRQNMVSDYERGKRRLSATMAERIASILSVKIDRLS